MYTPAPSNKRRSLITVVVVAVLALVGVVIWQLGGSGDETVEADATTATTASTPTTGAAAPDPTNTPGVTTPCPPAEGSTDRRTSFDGPPGICIDPTTGYSAVVATSKGNFTIELDPMEAPQAVNNFVVLARYHYYDGVPFHRVVPGFVIQAGDGDGTPDGATELGYTIADELPDSADAYVDYSVAMANRGPDTGASQFFVVLPGGGAQLTPSYSLFGQVTQGKDTVDAIGETGGSQDPANEAVINSVTIQETPTNN